MAALEDLCARTPCAAVHITRGIEATAHEGFDESRVRTVSKNAAPLKFEQSGFEERWS